MPASTPIVRSFGSYCTTRRIASVLMRMPARDRPAICHFEFDPNSSIGSFAAAAAASASRNSSGEAGC